MESLNHDDVCKALDNIQALLNCSTCLEDMTSPAYQCKNGHTICSSCKPKVYRKCPSCRAQIRDIRCLALEKMADSLVVNCKNKEYGCPQIIPFRNGHTHEEDSCKFRPYRCPLAVTGHKCDAHGDIPFLVSHLTDSHGADLLNDSRFQRQFVLEDHAYKNQQPHITVINCLGRYFCLHAGNYLHGRFPSFMVFISLIGNAEDVDGYGYRLETGGEGWKLIYRGKPWSNRECLLGRTAGSSDCLIVLRRENNSSKKTIKTKLEVTGRIWTTKNQKNPVPP